MMGKREMQPATASPFRECVPRGPEQLEQALVWQTSVFERQFSAWVSALLFVSELLLVLACSRSASCVPHVEQAPWELKPGITAELKTSLLLV
jgi:hypothetical protein